MISKDPTIPETFRSVRSVTGWMTYYLFDVFNADSAGTGRTVLDVCVLLLSLLSPLTEPTT